MKITLRQLEVFCAIARHAQVTRAAADVAMTQAAASMALADLERQLGCQLFDRVGRALLLNDAGRLLQGRAHEVLDRVTEIEQLASGEAMGFDLHIGTSVTVGNHLLPALVAGIKQRWPQARLQITRLNSRDVIEGLKAHRLDLGFVEGPDSDAAIQHLSWRQDALRLFAAPGHPLAGRPLSVADLQGTDWIVRESGSGTREVMVRACVKAGLTPRLGLELQQPEAIRQCVKAGLGIGCLSELELADALRAGTLVCLETPFLDMSRRLDIVLLRGRRPGVGMRAMLDLCGVALPA